MTSAALSSFLLALLLVGSVLMALRLQASGLHRQYPIFFLYFVFRIPNSLWPLFVDVRTNTYFLIFVFTMPVVLVFYVLLVRELYKLVLEDYRGLQTAGRWAMYASLVGAVAVAILTLIPKIQPSMPQRSQAIGYLLVSERGIDTALAMFIFLLLALLSRYPIHLRRNVRIHAVVYSVFFLSSTMAILARTILGMKSLSTLNTIGSVINVCCMFAWLILLRPAGEKAPARQVKAAGESERRLLLQLEGINAALLRVGRPKVG